MEDASQFSLSSGGGFFKQVYDVSDVCGPSSRGKDLACFGVESDEAYANGLLEHHVGKAGGEAGGVTKFA